MHQDSVYSQPRRVHGVVLPDVEHSYTHARKLAQSRGRRFNTAINRKKRTPKDNGHGKHLGWIVHSPGKKIPEENKHYHPIQRNFKRGSKNSQRSKRWMKRNKIPYYSLF